MLRNYLELFLTKNYSIVAIPKTTRILRLVVKTKKSLSYLIIISVFAGSSTQFTPEYQGKSVTGLAGSSVNFTWSFSGDVKKIQWGIKKDGVKDLNTSTILVSLDQSVLVPITVPDAYTGRVCGTRHDDSSSGQVLFTLSSVKKEDENIYGCRITSSDNLFPVVKFDYMQLVVEGKKFTTSKYSIIGQTTEWAKSSRLLHVC